MSGRYRFRILARRLIIAGMFFLWFSSAISVKCQFLLTTLPKPLFFPRSVHCVVVSDHAIVTVWVNVSTLRDWAVLPTFRTVRLIPFWNCFEIVLYTYRAFYCLLFICTNKCTYMHLFVQINSKCFEIIFFVHLNPTYPYLLTPWCRVLLEKLTGLQLVKNFPAFHGTRRFITALTSIRHVSLS